MACVNIATSTLNWYCTGMHWSVPELPCYHCWCSRVIIYNINTLTPCVCLFGCLSPLRSRERNIALPRFLYQCKELCLMTCTNCLMSSLLECKVVNAPFVFFRGLNVQHTKSHPPLSIQDIPRDFVYKYGETIHEWASIFVKMLWVIKCTVNYGSIHEWVSFFGPSRSLH